jgi:hypothetical protein
MKKTHKGAKDFLLGAFMGSVIGIAAVSLTRQGRKKNKQLVNSLAHFGKSMATARGEGNLVDIIDWTAEGIQLWNKLKKGS